VTALAQAPLAQASVAEGPAAMVCAHSGVSEDRALSLAADVEAELRKEGVTVAVSAPEAAAKLASLPECGAQRPCVADRGRTLRVPAVVAIYAAQVLSDLAVHLELVSSEKGEVLAQDDLIIPAGAPAGALSGQSARFAAASRVALARIAEQRPSRAERIAAAGPGEAGPTTVTTEPVAGRPIWVWAPALAGVIAVGVGGFYLAEAQSQVNRLESTNPRLTSDQAAQAFRDGVSQRRIGGCLVGAGVLAASTSLVLYKVGSPAASPVSLSPTVGTWGLSASARW